MADGAWERRSLRALTPCQVMDFNQYVVPAAQGEEKKEKEKNLVRESEEQEITYAVT